MRRRKRLNTTKIENTRARVIRRPRGEINQRSRREKKEKEVRSILTRRSTEITAVMNQLIQASLPRQKKTTEKLRRIKQLNPRRK